MMKDKLGIFKGLVFGALVASTVSAQAGLFDGFSNYFAQDYFKLKAQNYLNRAKGFVFNHTPEFVKSNKNDTAVLGVIALGIAYLAVKKSVEQGGLENIFYATIGGFSKLTGINFAELGKKAQERGQEASENFVETTKKAAKEVTEQAAKRLGQENNQPEQQQNNDGFWGFLNRMLDVTSNSGQAAQSTDAQNQNNPSNTQASVSENQNVQSCVAEKPVSDSKTEQSSVIDLAEDIATN